MSRVDDFVKSRKENPVPSFYLTVTNKIVYANIANSMLCNILPDGSINFIHHGPHKIEKEDVPRFIQWLTYCYSDGEIVSKPPEPARPFIEPDEAMPHYQPNLKKKTWWKFWRWFKK